jgi:hypothetical protein
MIVFYFHFGDSTLEVYSMNREFRKQVTGQPQLAEYGLPHIAHLANIRLVQELSGFPHLKS